MGVFSGGKNIERRIFIDTGRGSYLKVNGFTNEHNKIYFKGMILVMVVDGTSH